MPFDLANINRDRTVRGGGLLGQHRFYLGPETLVNSTQPLYHETVLRYGATGQAGYQFAVTKRFLVDAYAGLGLRKSHYWSDFSESQFRSGPSDYAHQGLYFPAGFKLGVALR